MTTLLSKEKENRQLPIVSAEQVKQIEEQVTVQGDKVKEAKAVSFYS